jgi:transposase
MAKRKHELKRAPADVQLGQTMTPEELAVRWTMSVGTLKNWRAQGRGPRYIPLTDTPRPPIRYLLADVRMSERNEGTACYADV